VLVIGLRLVWVPLAGGGAVRIDDSAIWARARRCSRCGQIGYDYSDPLARLEAERLDVWTSVCVVSCRRCAESYCALCLDAEGRCRLCAIVGKFELE
jgi:hypothetical protein